MIPLFLDLTHSIILHKGCTVHLLKPTLGGISVGKKRDAVGNFLSRSTANEYHLAGREAKSCWLDQVWFLPAFSCLLKREIHKLWTGNFWERTF